MRLEKILRQHILYLYRPASKYALRANLEDSNLIRANLRGANLRGADLIGANLRDANLRGANLIRANLRDANLRDADLSGAKLIGANLIDANLSDANLRGANLSGAKLIGANLIDANLSDAKNLLSQYDFLQNFQKTVSGILVYKTFDEHYSPNTNWKIEAGSILTETCNLQPTNKCGCGINVASLKWVKKKCNSRFFAINKEIWECEIPYGAAICVPYNTDGKFRTEIVKLIRKLEE